MSTNAHGQRPAERDLAAEGPESTNQPQTEPVPPSPADADAASAGSEHTDDAPADGPVEGSVNGAGVGAPEGTVPEVATALGTSEQAEPVDGVHTPDVGPGAEQFDTARAPMPGRTTESGDQG